jgi:hypothetical protein
MPQSAPNPPQPLTVAEQLDARLLGWLERHAAIHVPGRADLQAVAVVTVAERILPEVETFCANWGMSVSRPARGGGAWAVLHVRGRALPVQGFTELAAMDQY